MALPKNLVLIRHGQSEANIVQKSEEGFIVPEGFATRHDSFMRLSKLGVTQAQVAGEWLRENNLANFDRFYVSPHLRTRETAANLSLGGEWIIDDLWRERDWGEYGVVPTREAQKERFPYSYQLKEQNLWYWKPTGGESLATGVRYRVHSVLDNLRELENVDSVVGVTHGEFIRTMQFVLERMTPDEWIKMDADPAYSIKNCMVVHYTRTNPETGENGKNYKWVRMINTNPELPSPNDGQWKEIHTRKFSDSELIESVGSYAPFF